MYPLCHSEPGESLERHPLLLRSRQKADSSPSTSLRVGMTPIGYCARRMAITLETTGSKNMTQSANVTKTVKRSLSRTICRCIHLVFSIPILGYIYSPFDKLPSYAPKTRYVFVPMMILSGLWMWKGHV